MALLDELMDKFSGSTLSNMSSQIGASENQTRNALGSLLPIILNAVSKRGSSNNAGLGGLVGMLDMDNDGSILDDVAGFVMSGRQTNSGSILENLLGGNRNQIQDYVADDSGLDRNSTSRLMELAAPVVMSYLARKNNQSGNDLGGMLGGFLGQMNERAPQSTSIIDQLLDDRKSRVDNDIPNLGGSILGSLFR